MTFVKHLENVWNSKGLMLAFYTACYLAYIAFGGLIFLSIEGPQETATPNLARVARENFLKKYSFVTEESIDELLSAVSSVRVRGSYVNATHIRKWTYTQSVLFAVTLITSVGYGHVVPVSQAGKAASMLYTGLGLPFSLLMLAAYMQRFMAAGDALQKGLDLCLDHICRPIIIRIIHQLLVIAIILSVFFVIPMMVFFHYEKDWTYLDALYFCFISLTTVGLGDNVAGQNPSQPYQDIYNIGIAGYLLLGITAVMYLMTQISEFYQYMKKEVRDPETIPFLANIESYGAITIEEQNTQNQWQNQPHPNCVLLE